MKTVSLRSLFLAVSYFILIGGVLTQGNLTPPGAPAPTMKTLARIESNLVADNDFGIRVEGTKNFITRNSATDNTTAEFSVVGGNHSAPISINALTAGALDNFDQ